MEEVPKGMVFYGFHSVMVAMEGIKQSDQNRCRTQTKNDDYRVQCPKWDSIITIRSRFIQGDGIWHNTSQSIWKSR